jgi:predicted phosphodiesterase
MKNKIAIALAAAALLPINVFAMSLGLMSDEHTGSKKLVKMNMGIFQDKLAEIRSQNPDVIISTGDEAYKGEKAYYSQMKDMEGIIWVKGDDDSKKFSMLAPLNYTQDFDNLRVIVLDSTKKHGSGEGYLSKDQIKYLQQAENTDKDVIVAMHHPVFKRYTTNFNTKVYGKFLSALTPNVKMVVSGHWHRHVETEWNGIRFIVIPAMYHGDYLMENL